MIVLAPMIVITVNRYEIFAIVIVAMTDKHSHRHKEDEGGNDKHFGSKKNLWKGVEPSSFSAPLSPSPTTMTADIHDRTLGSVAATRTPNSSTLTQHLTPPHHGGLPSRRGISCPHTTRTNAIFESARTNIAAGSAKGKKIKDYNGEHNWRLGNCSSMTREEEEARRHPPLLSTTTPTFQAANAKFSCNNANESNPLQCFKCGGCVKCTCSCHTRFEIRNRFVGVQGLRSLMKCVDIVVGTSAADGVLPVVSYLKDTCLRKALAHVQPPHSKAQRMRDNGSLRMRDNGALRMRDNGALKNSKNRCTKTSPEASQSSSTAAALAASSSSSSSSSHDHQHNHDDHHYRRSINVAFYQHIAAMAAAALAGLGANAASEPLGRQGQRTFPTTNIHIQPTFYIHLHIHEKHPISIKQENALIGNCVVPKK